ncbi:unnamed protein product, partial [Brassica oleracea]
MHFANQIRICKSRSLVFMLLYLWSREFPNANISLYGLVNLKVLKAFYLPWAMLALDLLGIIAGHLYYFLTVLHPLATGKNYLKTPKWVNKLVARWLTGAPVAAREASGVGAAVGGSRRSLFKCSCPTRELKHCIQRSIISSHR